MKIGLIIACEDNIISELEKKSKYTERKIGVYTIKTFKFDDNEVDVLLSGIGEICASSATQILISVFGVEKIINVGVVGGLKENFTALTVALVKDVVHYDFDLSPIDPVEKCRYSQFESVYISTDREMLEEALSIAKLPTVRCASGDKFVNDPEKKIALSKEFDADICDMESAGILITCRNNNIPCLMIKAVSDSVNGGANEFAKLKEKAGFECMTILKSMLKF